MPLEAGELTSSSRDRRHLPAGAGMTDVAIDRDRLVDTASRMVGTPELHRRRAGDGRADGLALRGARPPLPVAAGRGRPRERARHPRGGGRREEPHAQRAHGHVVLGPGAVAPRRAGLPARGVRPRRPPVRARDLEHEGRARLLRRGRARAARRGRPPAGRPPDRGGLRRDREDPAGRRGRRRVPRLRGGHALPRLARRRRGHVPARRADRGQGRARALRRALAADPRPRRLHPHGVQRGAARPELDPPHARGARGGAGVDPDLGGRPGERVPRREGDRQRRRDRGRLRLARLAHAAPRRPVPRRPRPADEADGGRAARGARDGARPRGALPRRTGSRARSTSPRPAPRSTRATSSSRRSTSRTRRSSARRPAAT